ncbi:MAG: ABC transporter ATP-binding protein [Bacillota bacterium]|nr:ABC transporter ATP-binding protein [Bacillota bacterium]MDW7677000.1 ABC transporter ATP-binding protein [Bacillota bacterium]
MLRVENISKKLDNQPVIRSVSFQVKPGCFFTLLGDSGTGKTTLLKLIAGLESPEEGRVYLEGKDITAVAANRRRIPMIFQQPLLFPHLTVYQNIAFGLEMAGWRQPAVQERVRALLASLQITELDDRLPDTLSGGQQQRVSIARALAPGTDLVLMDEPFSSLDPSLRKEMGQLVKTLQRQMNLTVIFVTHDVTEALQLSDEILLLKEGRVLESGAPDQLFERPQQEDTARFLEAGNLVHGRVEQNQFHCFLGSFPAKETADGPTVGLFPESRITLTSGGSDYRVAEIRYLGKSRRIRVATPEQSLWVDDHSRQPLNHGQAVTLALPDRIHLIPLASSDSLPAG